MIKVKKRILFVGSFKETTKDGSVGGQMFASKTLINSELKNEFDFILIDSTADSVPAPPVYKRLGKVFLRFVKLIFYHIKYRPEYVLLFTSAGLSILEKGSMALISKFLFSKVVFAPRSGLIKSNIESSRFYRLFVHVVLRLSDKIICQGTSWKIFYKSLGNFKEEKFHVIPNWIDTSGYFINRPEYQNQDLFAKKLIYIGWIEEYKGIFDLLKAISIIKKKIPYLTVYIYGSGKMINEAKLLSMELQIEDKIVFCGWADKIMKLRALSDADLYILPSHSEGFPNALLEAMASGIPSIATDVGGIPDVLFNNETGLLIEPQKPDQIAKAILSLYMNPELRERLSKQGRKRVEDYHSLNAMYRSIKLILRA